MTQTIALVCWALVFSAIALLFVFAAHLHSVVHSLCRPFYKGELVLQLSLVGRVLLVVRVSASAFRFALLFPLLLSLRNLKEGNM